MDGQNNELLFFSFESIFRNFLVWEVPRQEEFAPLKNGYDAKKENPVTCRQNLYAQHYRWLKNAGAQFDNSEYELLCFLLTNFLFFVLPKTLFSLFFLSLSL